MQAQNESLVGFLEGYLQPLVDILGIDWITLLLVLDTLILLIIFVLIRVISGRKTVKIKLTVPKLPEEASLIPKEKFNGLTALFNSTNGALQILETLHSRKEIGSQIFDHLNLRYQVQLKKINAKFIEEMNAAERDRLQKTFDKSIQSETEEAEPTTFPYLDLISTPSEMPSGSPSIPSSSPPSGPPTGGPPTGGPPSGPPSKKPKGGPPPPPPSEK